MEGELGILSDGPTPEYTLREISALISPSLAIQSIVTCPGTWLCPNGKVILRVTMLGTKVRTSSMTPVFPLLYHEKFIFQKTFSGSCCLSEVERIINQEVVLAELVQWPDDDADIILASFETTLLELLYPSPCDRGLISGVDVDLLMEPSPNYPGILAPKIEVSTKTTIEEVTKSSCSSQDISCNIINPKMLSSKGCTLPKRRKKVFHSIYHPKKCPKLRGRSCRLKKPPTTRNHCNHPHKHPSCFPPEHCPPFKHDRRHKCYACLEIVFLIVDKYTPSDNSIFENTLPCSPRCGQTSYTRHCTVDSGKAVNKSLQCGDVKLDGCTKLHDLAKFNNHIKPSWKPCKPAPQPRSCPPCPAKSVLEPKSCPQSVFHEPLQKAQETHENLERHLNYAQNYPFLEEKEYHSSLKYPCNLHPKKLTSKDDNHTCSSYREMFYSGLEKFYKKLHNRYKKRAGEDATCS
uniref:Spermatogenesis-associated protein 6 N-terminal domain-containing protein n=1 Tax=Timema bartmani TaxID=61472 RepID=A0A7R9EMD3_9NEOP|nr:unnamed protein product [Timema bartmani]